MTVKAIGLTAKGRGFTLIELMITVAMLAILLSLAAPSFSNLLKTQQVRTVATDFYSDLVFARSEAIKRNAMVMITPKDTAAGKDWAKGWDVTTVVGAATATLKSRSAEAAGVTALGVNTALSYGAAGRLVGVTTTQSITIAHPDIGALDQRCVTVDFSGRATVKSGVC